MEWNKCASFAHGSIDLFLLTLKRVGIDDPHPINVVSFAVSGLFQEFLMVTT